MYVVDSDPTSRTPDSTRARPCSGCACARSCGSACWRSRPPRSGRAFGLHDLRFIAAELALLVSMFVISRYVLPLVERRDRGARGEEHVGELLDALAQESWRVIHDASLGHGNVDHIVIGPAGVFTVETKSHPGPVRVRRMHGATISQAQAQAQGDASR